MIILILNKKLKYKNEIISKLLKINLIDRDIWYENSKHVKNEK